MTKSRLLIAAAVLGLATQASAACGWYGTQLECRFGGSDVLVGTQNVDRPTRVRGFEPQALRAGAPLLEDRPLSTSFLRVELQNVGTAPGLCHKVGNETYCY